MVGINDYFYGRKESDNIGWRVIVLQVLPLKDLIKIWFRSLSDCDLLQGRKINVEEWSYEPVILQK